MAVLTLLTDFGTADYYVGAVKGTVLRLADPPPAYIVDLSHKIAPGDVEGAGWVLAAAAPSFPAGTVHLAVVDPGVGSERRILAARAGGMLFVAPDNGLLGAVLATDPEAEVRSVARDDLFLPSPGHTFHGRDRFAPLAAALLSGVAPAELGSTITNPVRLAGSPPQREGGRLVGRIAHIDRFGNLITDLPNDWLSPGPVLAHVAGRRIDRRVTHYAALPVGEAGILAGSVGTLELARRGGSLAKRWDVRRGAPVVLTQVEAVEAGAADSE